MRSILHLLLLVILAAACAAQTDSSSQLSNQQRFDPDRIDKALDPCNDFFEYACSKWLKANPIPGDQAGWGTLNVMNIWNTSAVRNTLEEAAAAPKPNPVEKKVGDYYASCMDESAVNKAGIAPLQPALDRIAALKSKDQMPELLAYIHQNIRPADLNYIDAQYGGVLFGIFSTPDFNDASLQLAALDQSGMGLPSRDFYLKDDEKSKKIRDQYLQYISKVLELSGEPAAQASSDSQTILSMETALANGAMDIILRRDPKNLNNRMSLEQLQQLTPSFNWSSYFAAMQAPTSPTYLVLAPDFYRGIEKLLASESVDHWRAYLRYSMLRMNASLLSQPFVDANFNFFSRTLFGAQQLPPRWRRCSNYADADLGEAVGQAYSAKYFPPASKARMLEMVHAIENALHADIDSRDWMSPETKKLAHAKLRAQVDKIGYPDQWRDYSSVEIKRDDFLGNAQRSAHFEIDRRLQKIGKPSDRKEWGMTPPTVNAYEDPQTNTINFPAGILQPPAFDVTQIDAVNFGATGAVIGHEITHGYDDQGRKFDAQGNLRDWWTAADAAAYEQRDKCITDQYTQEVPEAGVKQNGKLSAGEDTADNGGVRLSLMGLESTLKAQGKTLESPALDGMTQAQAFFASYGNIWCGSYRPEAARTAVLTQGHSLNRYRVNNVLQNMPEFSKAFGCKAGQKMVRQNQCRVW